MHIQIRISICVYSQAKGLVTLNLHNNQLTKGNLNHISNSCNIPDMLFLISQCQLLSAKKSRGHTNTNLCGLTDESFEGRTTFGFELSYSFQLKMSLLLLFVFRRLLLTLKHLSSDVRMHWWIGMRIKFMIYFLRQYDTLFNHLQDVKSDNHLLRVSGISCRFPICV